MPDDLLKICEERARLLRNYSDAASNYSESVREMVELVMSGQEQRMSQARQNCRAAWDATEKSRLALFRHEADHHCDRGAQVPSVCDR
jgi:hypothetical protein